MEEINPNSDALPANQSNDTGNDQENSMSDEQLERQIQSLVAALDNLEDTLSAELEVLKENIGHEFKGYAEAALSIGENLHNIAQATNNPNAAFKINVATYVVAAGFALWGKHKEVKAHNDYLDKLLSIKQNLAQERIDRMSALIPRLTSKRNMAGRLLQSYAELTIPAHVLNNEDVLKLKANQGNRILALYRSASYMLKLSNYIYKEAKVWKNGQHTANTLLPGYSDVIVDIDKWLYQSPSGGIVDSYCELAMDRQDQVLGKDLLLVCDPQSTSYALYNMDYVQIEPSNSPIGKLIASNPAIAEYKKKVGNVAEYISEHEKQPTIPLWLPVIMSLIGLGIIWVLMNCNVGGGTVLSVLYLSGIWFTCFDYNSRLKHIFYYGLNNLIVDGDEATKQAAGYVEQPEHNYEKKSFFKSLFD